MTVLLTADPKGDPGWKVWLDLIYHACNLVMMLLLFYSYLVESFWNVKLYYKKVLLIVAVCSCLILGYGFVLTRLPLHFDSDALVFAAYGVLPLAEIEMTHLASSLVLSLPLWGFLCVVLMTPLTTSCMFYAAIFAPVCCERPKLAYPVLCLVLAIPRIVNALSFWDPMEELILYLVQLPIHLICCWSYQKTDTVWTPIAILFLSNLISSCFVMYCYGMI